MLPQFVGSVAEDHVLVWDPILVYVFLPLVCSQTTSATTGVVRHDGKGQILHGNCMANAWQVHGNCMATAWQLHCNCVSNLAAAAVARPNTAWQLHGKCMASAWQLHGNCVTKLAAAAVARPNAAWQLHGNCMATAWQLVFVLKPMVSRRLVLSHSWCSSSNQWF